MSFSALLPLLSRILDVHYASLQLRPLHVAAQADDASRTSPPPGLSQRIVAQIREGVLDGEIPGALRKGVARDWIIGGRGWREVGDAGV